MALASRSDSGSIDQLSFLNPVGQLRYYVFVFGFITTIILFDTGVLLGGRFCDHWTARVRCAIHKFFH